MLFFNMLFGYGLFFEPFSPRRDLLVEPIMRHTPRKEKGHEDIQDLRNSHSGDHIRDRAPYQIFRFRPGVEGIPGQ